jgi:hypothetical protein
MTTDPIGTAFLTLIIQEGETFGYIVTCKHVVRQGFDKGGTLCLRADRQDDTGTEFVVLPKEGWLYHEDAGIDLAVLRYPSSLSGELLPLELRPIRIVAYEFEDVIIDERTVPGHTVGAFDPAFFVGLFPRMPGQLRNNPVFRAATVVAPPEEPLRWKDFGPALVYSLECHFNEGNSGAPLYQVIADSAKRELKVQLLGVICAGFPDAGIAVALPVARLAEILRGQPAVKQRQQWIDDKRGGSVLLAVASPEFTRGDMEAALKKVSRRRKPSKPAPRKKRT